VRSRDQTAALLAMPGDPDPPRRPEGHVHHTPGDVMIRMLLGAALIAAVLFGITAMMASEVGWTAALATWLLALVSAAALVGGISLLAGGRR
jgi:hypothetical protein